MASHRRGRRVCGRKRGRGNHGAARDTRRTRAERDERAAAHVADTGESDSSSPASEVARVITTHVEDTKNGRIHSAACTGTVDGVARCAVRYYYEDTRCWVTYRVRESGQGLAVDGSDDGHCVSGGENPWNDRPGQARAERPWLDGRGNTVSEHVVSTYWGADHCGWDFALFLHIGWPLGTNWTIGEGFQYVRDPKGLDGIDSVAPLDLDATLPAAATYTGYHQHKKQLWVSDGEVEKAVYIVRGDKVERWPRTTEIIACA